MTEIDASPAFRKGQVVCKPWTGTQQVVDGTNEVLG
jgi:hypothetical protein